MQLKAGPPKNPNFPWILLDRALFYYHNILIRAHGRRDAFVIKPQPDERSGFTAKFPSHRRHKFQRWFTKLLKGKVSPDTEDIFEELRAVLEEMRGDEIAHGAAARDAGGSELPPAVREAMHATAKVMTSTSYWF